LILYEKILCYTTGDRFNKNRKGGNMAKAKKATCAAKTTKGEKCKNPSQGKSVYCTTHKKK
jgi:hypothetical protein